MTAIAVPAIDIELLTAIPADVHVSEGCDACGYSQNGFGARIAPAFIRATFAGGSSLLFCKSHHNRFAAKLTETAVRIEDWSSVINVKPSTSANAD